MIRLRIPYKSFILGEYAVLDGGLCLGAATEPYFEIDFKYSNKEITDYNKVENVENDYNLDCFHKDSPAGKFLQKNEEIFQNIEIKFNDPKRVGGFGASTAQYLGLLVYRECIAKDRKLDDLREPSEIKKIIDEYRGLATQDGARSPSGADLVIQLVGGVSWINTSSWDVQKLHWPWPQATGYFISTGHKLATHLHLQYLSDFNSSELFRILQLAKSSMKSNNFADWLESINNYSHALGLMGLVTTETDSLLTEVRQWPGVLATKGCGALGADVIFCVVQNELREKYEELIRRKDLQIITSTEHVADGVQLLVNEALIESEIVRG